MNDPAASGRRIIPTCGIQKKFAFISPALHILPGGLNTMKRAITILFFLLVIFSAPAFANKDSTCHPPYQPTNILKLLLNYSATLDYIATAPEQCQKPFQRDVTELVRSTWLFTEGCKKVTFEDFEKAEKKRDENNTPKQGS
jgi:hypothetical protein